MVQACLLEGKIDMSARRQVTNKLREAYQGASKPDKGRILDEVQSTTGVARSSARRLLLGPKLPEPREQVDKRVLRARVFSDASRELLTHLWLLMGRHAGSISWSCSSGGSLCCWRRRMWISRSRQLSKCVKYPA